MGRFLASTVYYEVTHLRAPKSRIMFRTAASDLPRGYLAAAEVSFPTHPKTVKVIYNRCPWLSSTPNSANRRRRYHLVDFPT